MTNILVDFLSGRKLRIILNGHAFLISVVYDVDASANDLNHVLENISK